MPFQPGNKLHELRVNKSGAVATEKRKANVSLAMHIRETVNFPRMIERLEQMALGVNPATGEPIDDKGQRDAMRMLLERGHGMAAQHVVLEGILKSEITINASPHERMTLEQINARRAELALAKVKRLAIDVATTPRVTDDTDDE